MHNFNKLRRKRKGAKKLKIIDLSRTITPGMQGFPGDAAPAIERREDGGFRTGTWTRPRTYLRRASRST